MIFQTIFRFFMRYGLWILFYLFVLGIVTLLFTVIASAPEQDSPFIYQIR